MPKTYTDDRQTSHTASAPSSTDTAAATWREGLTLALLRDLGTAVSREHDADEPWICRGLD